MARRAFVVLLVLALGLAAACTGDDDDDDSDAAGENGALTTSTPSATATATQAPPETATSTPTATPAVEPTEAALPTAVGGSASAAIASPYERYHYVLTIDFSIAESSRGDTGPLLEGSVEGDYVAPDRHAFTNAFALAGFGFEASAIVIGDEAWTRDSATAPWAPTTIEALWDEGSADLTSLDPELFLYDSELAGQFSALRGTAETRAGVETVRYEVTPELFEVLASVLSPDLLLGFDPAAIDEFAMTVWVDPETNGVVALDILFAGSVEAFGGADEFGLPDDATVALMVGFEVTRIDDPSVIVEPPVE